MPMPSMGYWGAWRCMSAKAGMISRFPQFSTGQAAYRSGRTGNIPWITPSSRTKYPPARVSSSPRAGVWMTLPRRIFTSAAMVSFLSHFC